MMLSEVARALWGKSDREKKDGVWHPLICHMVDVAACVLQILEREPKRTRELYAQDLGFNNFEQARPWLALFIALHDLGKASPSFQSLWELGADQVQALGLTWRGKPAYIPHGFISQAAFPELKWCSSVHADALCRIADAVACHHGLRATSTEIHNMPSKDCGLGQPDWVGIRQKLFEACIDLFKVNLEQPLLIKTFSAAAFERLAGVCSFADWLGSNQDFFEFEPNMTDLQEYWKKSLIRADNALDRIAWKIRLPLKIGDLIFDKIFPFSPRPLQSTVIEMLKYTKAPTMLLIEGPMGEAT
jgi:CRISPR-associated endonuclease/helicase Cas3